MWRLDRAAIPPLRLPLYFSWMRLLRPIGWVVTHVLLGFVFYVSRN